MKVLLWVQGSTGTEFLQVFRFRAELSKSKNVATLNVLLICRRGCIPGGSKNNSTGLYRATSTQFRFVCWGNMKVDILKGLTELRYPAPIIQRSKPTARRGRKHVEFFRNFHVESDGTVRHFDRVRIVVNRRCATDADCVALRINARLQRCLGVFCNAWLNGPCAPPNAPNIDCATGMCPANGRCSTASNGHRWPTSTFSVPGKFLNVDPPSPQITPNFNLCRTRLNGGRCRGQPWTPRSWTRASPVPNDRLRSWPRAKSTSMGPRTMSTLRTPVLPVQASRAQLPSNIS